MNSMTQKPSWMDESHYREMVDEGFRLVRGIRMDSERYMDAEYFTEYPYGVWEREGEVMVYNDGMGSGSIYDSDEIAEVYEFVGAVVTPEQEALIGALRAWPSVDYVRMRELVDAACVRDDISVMTTVGMSTQARSITEAGRLILALAAERDLYRLKAEWQEARFDRADAALDLSSASEEGANDDAIERALSALAKAEVAEDAARAAYVAAGGVA